jgi:predicted dehydrogenase
VTIATPPHTDAALALDAIAAGKHVICVKPFTADTAEARAVLAAAEAARVVHLLRTEFRWDPGQATLARAIVHCAVPAPVRRRRRDAEHAQRLGPPILDTRAEHRGWVEVER